MVGSGVLVKNLGFEKLFLLAGVLGFLCVIYYYFVSAYTYNHKKINH